MNLKRKILSIGTAGLLAFGLTTCQPEIKQKEPVKPPVEKEPEYPAIGDDELCPDLAICTAKTEISKQKMLDLLAIECEKNECMYWVCTNEFAPGVTMKEGHVGDVEAAYDYSVGDSFNKSGRAGKGMYHEGHKPCYSDKNRADAEYEILGNMDLLHSEEMMEMYKDFGFEDIRGID